MITEKSGAWYVLEVGAWDVPRQSGMLQRGGPKCIAKHKGVANPLSQVKKNNIEQHRTR